MLVQPMRLDVLRGGPGPLWDTDLQAVGGTVFHSTVWARYVLAQQPHVHCLFVRLADDTGQTRGMALAFRTVWPREPLPPLSRSLWLDALPVVAGPAPEPLLTEFLSQLRSFAQRAADVDLHVGSFASPGAAMALRGLGFDCVRRLEFVRPLDVSEESLWVALGSKARNTLRKASRLGVTIHELTGEEAARELRRLQRASAGRIAARGGSQLVLPRAEGTDPVTILLDAGVGRILAARFEGACVSAALLTRFNGLVYYTLAGHSEAGLRSQAPTLLLWEAMKRYRQEGAHTFNIGGCRADAADEHSAEHGLYVYKQSLASQCVECTSGSLVLRRQVYRVVSGLRRAAAVLRHA
jgi:GNAT acetyltransferase-like protein